MLVEIIKTKQKIIYSNILFTLILILVLIHEILALFYCNVKDKALSVAIDYKTSSRCVRILNLKRVLTYHDKKTIII